MTSRFDVRPQAFVVWHGSMAPHRRRCVQLRDKHELVASGNRLAPSIVAPAPSQLAPRT